jgi:hypothetical protein
MSVQTGVVAYEVVEPGSKEKKTKDRVLSGKFALKAAAEEFRQLAIAQGHKLAFIREIHKAQEV